MFSCNYNYNDHFGVQRYINATRERSPGIMDAGNKFYISGYLWEDQSHSFVSDDGWLQIK